MREQKAKAEVKKKKNKLWDNTQPLSPTHILIWINHPLPQPMPSPPPPIIRNNNTMDTEFLVQIR